MRCKFCSKKPVVRVRYANLTLCRDHFIEYFEKRVKRTIERYKMIREGERICCAVSGGKDSAVMLYVLKKLCKNVEIQALHLNLGIGDYSKKSVKKTIELCRQLDVEVEVVDIAKEYGFTIDLIKKLERKIKRPICSACGLIKRYLMNRYCYENGFDKLATGHNLDDEAANILSNYISGDIELLARGGPVQKRTHPKLIPRIKPLYEVSEKETFLYAELMHVPYLIDECPYSYGAPNLLLKTIIAEVEDARPSSRISLVRNFVKRIKPALEEYTTKNTCEKHHVKECSICGMPTSTSTCAFCRFVERVKTLSS